MSSSTHVVPADPGDRTIASPNRRAAVFFLWYAVSLAAVLGFCLFGVWMNPVVSIDSVSTAGLQLVPDDAAAGAGGGRTNGTAAAVLSPSFDVTVRLRTRWFHLFPTAYANGTVAVSCAGGAVAARGVLEDTGLSSLFPSVVSATVRAPPSALPGDARGRLDSELRRGEVHLDVSVAYEPYPGFLMTNAFRARCEVTLTPFGGGNLTAPAPAPCTVVKR